MKLTFDSRLNNFYFKSSMKKQIYNFGFNFIKYTAARYTTIPVPLSPLQKKNPDSIKQI